MEKVISILLITILFCCLSQSCLDCRTTLEKSTKPNILAGIIIDRDSLHNHGIPIIKIRHTDGTVQSFGMGALESLWNASLINDSIYKAKNSLAFQIIRQDTILTFYPVCGCCDTLK